MPRPAHAPARAAAERTRHATPVLSAGQAERLAEHTHRRVTVSALTTPTSATTANPGGSFTVTEWAVPVRAWRGGRWRSLDATLHAQRNGRIAPAVTTNGLSLSGGGAGPLVTMTSSGRALSLSWPGLLPIPTLSGSTATYANVLPGVDLIVTADDQGGFSDVLEVHSAAAAANPALAALKLTTQSQGLVLSTDAAGNLSAAVGPTAPALITAQAPLIWDSTPPPAGMPTVTSPDGTVLDAATGLPAYSSLTAPGAAANTATVPVTLSGNTLTLAPPASVLTGSDSTYPVFIDPTWHNFASSEASRWTQVDSGFPTTSYWQEKSDLQVGDCPSSITPPSQSCDGMGVARSFLRMPIPSQLTSTTDVHSGDLYMTEDWAPSCNKKSVRLYTTGSIDSSTTWNHQPSWSSNYSYQDAAFGYPGCGYYKDDITWDVTETIADDAGSQSSQTWGVRAADEGDQYAWKQFKSGGSDLHMSVTYNYPPNKPDRTTSPGGDCFYSASGAPVIGNNDVTFNASASDNDGDNNLTTEFIILNSSGATVYDSGNPKTNTNVVTGNNAIAELSLSRSTMQGLSPNGSTTAYTYHWYALTTDEFSLTSKQPTDNCYFTYNPVGPAAPTVTVGSGQLGTPVAASFTAPTGCGGASPCPVSYTYQLGATPPQSVNANASGDWSGNITINQIGPIQLTVYGVASGGNLSPPATAETQGSAPQSPYEDGYFTGPGYPDLLTLGTGAKPSLWLSTGSKAGQLNAPVDIGSLGTGINPGTDGPGDWAGAEVLHGDFTGDGVQDAIAYYPATGSGEVVAGNGNASTIVPNSLIDSSRMQNTTTGDDPTQLVGAGGVSQIGTGTDDLIGVSGDSTNGYELDLYTNGLCSGCASGGGYQFNETLTAQSPGGDSWGNYTLAAVNEPPDTTDLFALDSTGALYECTNPIDLPPGSSPAATWTPITVPWGSSPPALVSGDLNNTNATELWTVNAARTTATAYTLSGSTLSQEGQSSLAAPSDDWPLTDGNLAAQGSGATTAIDTISGNTAAFAGNRTWTTDDYFGTTAGLDGSTEYLTPPANTIPTTDATPSLSVWFKTTTANGNVLVSVQNQAVSAGNTIPTGFDPVMYVGTDGKLYAEWWKGSVGPVASSATVDDGLWHHAVLTATGSGGGSQSLYLDGQLQGTISGTVDLSQDSPTNLTFGTGYIGGNWPTEPYYHQSGGTLDYFQGQLADITFTK